MLRYLRVQIAILIGLFSVGTAHADYMFSFHFDQSNYSVAPNGTVDVEVFLRQAGLAGAGEQNILGGPGAVGMTGTGVRVTFPTGPNDAQVLSVNDITGNAAFDNFGFGPFTSVDSGSALLSQATSGTAVLGTLVAPDTYDLFLGTFQFTAGGVPGQVTPITTSLPLFPDSSDNVANTTPLPTVLTDIDSGTATITVAGGGSSPAPAPGSAVLCVSGAALISAWAARSRKRAQVRASANWTPPVTPEIPTALSADS